MTDKKLINILVVEDQESLRSAISDELSFSGYKVITARDGEQGLEIAKSNSLDLIVSDIFMPNYDGYWLLCELRKVNKTYPPFILQIIWAPPNSVRFFQII